MAAFKRFGEILAWPGANYIALLKSLINYLQQSDLKGTKYRSKSTATNSNS